MSKHNKFGLSRNIPESVKREVRQKCGFGCVVCGAAIYQYEHVDPEFSEAIKHDPNGIVLLCASCHDRVTRGILSKQTVKNCSKNPKCKDIGYSFGPFDFGIKYPEILLGPLVCLECKSIITIKNESILSIASPEFPGKPFLINALLKDNNGGDILKIKNNEWHSNSANWDVKVVGRRIFISSSLNKVLLILRSEPQRALIVEKLVMKHRNVSIEADERKKLEINLDDGTQFTTSEMTIIGAEHAIRVFDKTLQVGVKSNSIIINNAELTAGADGCVQLGVM